MKEHTRKDSRPEDRRRRYREILENFTLMSDTFMRNVFKKPECTEYVLQVIMNQGDLKVLEQVLQKDYKNLQGRSAILDCVAQDAGGRQFNVEIQQDAEGGPDGDPEVAGPGDRAAGDGDRPVGQGPAAEQGVLDGIEGGHIEHDAGGVQGGAAGGHLPAGDGLDDLLLGAQGVAGADGAQLDAVPPAGGAPGTPPPGACPPR